MSGTHNAPGLFKEQRRRSRSTWSAATSFWGLRAGGGRLLSIHLVRDNQTGSQAEKSNHNPRHHVSFKTEDRNFEARRFNIHQVLGGCSADGASSARNRTAPSPEGERARGASRVYPR
jgi:hypothetical protein